jgi:hypothetical protein
MADHRAFGRYHDVVLLLLGFVLTTLVGGVLSRNWQRTDAEIQRAGVDRRLEREAATSVFEELSRMMDKRLYRMRRVQEASPGSNPESARRWQAYQESLFEWNENLNRNLALTQRYFGDRARYILESDIQGGFRHLGALLEGRGFPDSAVNRSQYRQNVADSVNNLIYRFDVALISAIQRGEVGQFRVSSK